MNLLIQDEPKLCALKLQMLLKNSACFQVVFLSSENRNVYIYCINKSFGNAPAEHRGARILPPREEVGLSVQTRPEVHTQLGVSDSLI